MFQVSSTSEANIKLHRNVHQGPISMSVQDSSKLRPQNRNIRDMTAPVIGSR